MKETLSFLKQNVFRITGISDTKQLKKQRPDLTKGLDLRKKASWKYICEILNKEEIKEQPVSMFDYLLSKGDHHSASQMLIQQGENDKAKMRAKTKAAIEKILSI